MQLRQSTAFLLCTLAACCASQPQESQRPEPRAEARNVLFIAVDDLRPELGCYGVAHARSPHLDAFARTAMVFENHFVQAPSCGPSRYALLTGRSPARSGAVRNDALFNGPTRLLAEQQVGAQSMPELFRRNGYRTICVGKVSHTPDGRVFAYDGTGDGREELPHAWDELPTPFGPWQRGWGTFFAYANGAHREDGAGHDNLMQFDVERDTDLPDGLMAREAADQLAALAQREEPFFLGVGFFKPHLPFVATAQDRAALDDVDVPLPPEGERWRSPYSHGSGEFKRYTSPFTTPLPKADADVIETRRAYLACVRYVDRQIGVVLKALDDAGLADSTTVVIWGDHGWHLGDSGIWGKHTVLDRSLRSPLLIRAPGVTQSGSRTTALASSIDLYPTLVELCDLPARGTAHPLDGVSLVPLLDRSTSQVRAHTTAYYGKAATLRTLTHRLVARQENGDWKDVRVFPVAEGPDPLEIEAGAEASGPSRETIALQLLSQLPLRHAPR